jgi:hypothetical protein
MKNQMEAKYLEWELEDFIIHFQSVALENGYDLDVRNQENILQTLSDVISQISFKYDLWKIIAAIEVVIDNNLLFSYYRNSDVYGGSININFQHHYFDSYHYLEEEDVGEGKILLEINLTPEFAESLIFMSSYDKEEVLRPIEDILRRTDIIVNFDVSGGRIYLEVPIEVNVVKYLL